MGTERTIKPRKYYYLCSRFEFEELSSTDRKCSDFKRAALTVINLVLYFISRPAFPKTSIYTSIICKACRCNCQDDSDDFFA